MNESLKLILAMNTLYRGKYCGIAVHIQIKSKPQKWNELRPDTDSSLMMNSTSLLE